MAEVIPTIIVQNFQELEEKIRKVEPYVKWAQLDIMDGKFVDNITWNNPDDLVNLKTKLNLEAHLMIEKPEDKIDEWIVSGVKRIIFHYEATDRHKEIIDKISQAGLEAGLAINPETSIEVLDDFSVNLILVMTVEPGKGGQNFLEGTLSKIKNLRAKYPDINIEVDGGINLETAPNVIRAGANLLAAGSAIFRSQDIKKTIKLIIKKYGDKKT